MYLTHIYTYPVKSLGGISMQNSPVRERGLELDRRWMLVDKDGNFITQREYPRMADLMCSLEHGQIKITSKSGSFSKHSIPVQPQKSESRVKVRVWDSVVDAVYSGKEHDKYFSEAIGASCRLVNIDSRSKRRANRLITGTATDLSFADAYPYLIISQASLDDLNSRLELPVGMSRFRPNLVIDGCKAYEEDTIKDLQIGNIRFQIVKKCPRCSIPTIDPETYQKGKDPIRTLAKYRTEENQVVFGVNAIARDYGNIHVNEPVEFIER